MKQIGYSDLERILIMRSGDVLHDRLGSLNCLLDWLMREISVKTSIKEALLNQSLTIYNKGWICLNHSQRH
jgi:hypothetical protein